ncbi:MAG TPA: RHS repeat-associated core domain-containing protein [Thermoanaerobaculia bacterium]|nr:RHS repeat-associated core domain-containing protein [Thermoanaerobaculia bacterium]
MVDEFGQTLAWSYIGDRLDRVTDVSGSGRSIQIHWGADGRISGFTDPIGRTVSYTYANGVLVAMENPLGQITHYDYDHPGKYAPLLTSITDHWSRNVTTVVYDGSDRVASYTHDGETFDYLYGYGAASVTAKRDSAGNLWRFPFTTAGLVTQSIPPGGGPATQTTYDANGLLELLVKPSGIKTRYTYDSRGNVRTASLDYDGPSEVEWRYTYDPDYPGQPTLIVPYKRGTNEVHGDWQGTKYTYHPPSSLGAGLVHKIYDLDNDGVTERLKSSYTYDEHGRVIETLVGGAAWTLKYDTAGNLIESLGAANNDAGTRPLVKYSYDSVGRVETRTDANGNVSTFVWDALDRLKTRIGPTPSSDLTFVSTTHYDEFEASSGLMVTRFENFDGTTTSVAHDVYGQLVRATDAAHHTILYTWENGRMTSKQNENEYPTLYEYDVLNNLRKVSHPNGTVELFTYDVDGRIKTYTDRAGTVRTLGYDHFDRVVTMSDPDGSVVKRNFDGQKLISVEDARPHAAGTVSRTWDSSFRMATETQGTRGNLAWTYDALGRPLTQTVGGGAVTTYGYYPDGHVRTIDWSEVPGSFVLEYDLAGQHTKTTFPNGQTRTSTYDARGRVTSVANLHPSGNLATFGYEHDRDAFTGQNTQLDLLTKITTSFPALSLSGAVTKFSYDDRQMLVRAAYPAGALYGGRSTAWTYDAAGNRTSVAIDGATTAYTYRKYGTSALNGSELLSDGANAYSYDSAGNTKTRTGARGNYSFAWDLEHRLVSVTGSESESYRYDQFRRLAEKTNGSGTTRYLYQSLDVVAESGSSNAQYLFVPDLDEPLAMVRGGQVYYYGVDGLGSIVSVNDSSGTVVNTYAYDAWGESIARSEQVANPFGYTARPHTAAGLSNHRFRYYEPASGSFRSVDPLILTDQRTVAERRSRRAMELAPYSYAEGRPTMLTDLLGLDAGHKPDVGPGVMDTLQPYDPERGIIWPKNNCEKKCHWKDERRQIDCDAKQADDEDLCDTTAVREIITGDWTAPVGHADCYKRARKPNVKCQNESRHARLECDRDCETENCVPFVPPVAAPPPPMITPVVTPLN